MWYASFTRSPPSFVLLMSSQHGMADGRVWGVAYRIKPSKVEEVKEYLDIREVGGYSIHYEPFHPADEDKPPFRCLVYIGLPNNPQFLGVQDPQGVAEVISVSVGPSGENTEYLFQLEESLNGLGEGSGDAHIHDLVRRVRILKKLDERLESPKMAMVPNGYVEGTGLTKVGSTDEQEEIEKES
jgi:glutathione-specific gamma-glutamylcyclotransferase